MNSKKFHLIAICAAVSCLIISASAYVYSVTIESAWPVDKQVNELMTYISKLPKETRAEWTEKLTAAINSEAQEPPGIVLPFASGSFDSVPDAVFISPTGKAYHRFAECQGLRFASDIERVSKTKAIKMGRKPCKICCGD